MFGIELGMRADKFSPLGLSMRAYRPGLARTVAAAAALCTGISRGFQGSVADGQSEGTETPIVFSLKVAPVKRYLVDQRDVPFLIHRDSAWRLRVALTTDGFERNFLKEGTR
jgi:hypothetical protein